MAENKFEYRKTGEQERGGNVYDVFMDGRKIGTLHKEYCKAHGNPRYVGHWSGYYEWQFDVEEWAYESGLFRGGCYRFDSQKEAKAFLEGDKSKWERLP